ncbi:ATP-binding cassette domain-containing protein [Caryophanon latum]|uniref:ABC transporter domain-containing protein n=1 Tax=Caryophanon latum TaxID=33977 RepID=A0A1C0YU78_9BACL|nr:ATP-binding cassette domain-containing protein [Caryophanon latum]OCS90709.1 hypothetical protein A6K76_01265 [Caryophanon latum]
MYPIPIQHGGYIQNKPVLQDVQFSLPAHAIIRLIGGNGAGKSTTIQALLQTLPYAEVTHNLPNYLGYVPERPILYEYYTLREHIHLLIQMFSENEAALWQRALDLCKTFKLHDNKRVD